jgi:hypothetical protein
MITREEINTLLEKLAYHKDTHPNIITMWEHYLKLKIDAVESCYKSCNEIIAEIEQGNQDDPPVNALIALTIFGRAIRGNIT